MSQQPPPPSYPQQPGEGQSYPPPGGYYQPGPPPKKKHTLRNVLLILVLLFVLVVGGCLALVGTAANEIDKAIKEGENEAGGRANPVKIVPGEAFEVRGFDYSRGWTIGKDMLGDVEIKKLKVTNNRDDRDSALVEIKLWRGTEVLATSDCSTEPIEVGTTVSLSCFSADKMPAKYDKITINDSF